MAQRRGGCHQPRQPGPALSLRLAIRCAARLGIQQVTPGTHRVLPNKSDLATYEEKHRRADIALHALTTAVKADYTRVILVFHATKDEAISGKADGLAHYRAVAQEQGIDFISAIELYARAYKSNLPPQYDDIHLSKDGARMLSERLASDIAPLNSRN